MNYTAHQYDILIQFVRSLLIASKRKTGYAMNIMEASHNRPTLPPRNVKGMRCLVDDANRERVDAWIASMRSAAIRDGLTVDEIDVIWARYIKMEEFIKE